MKLAAIQMLVSKSKQANLARATKLVNEASKNGANLIVLPECFNCPYGTKYFPDYAESVSGETATALSAMASTNKIWLVGGSFPESDGGKLYNTSLSFDPSGKLVATHRKVHLFDIEIPNGIKFKESETLSAGNSHTWFPTPFGNVGVGICYDMRFPEMAMVASRKHECKIMVFPGAFNMTTGPLHWELLLRSRAVDNQMYVVGCAPARDVEADYISYGHSMAVDPMGAKVGSTEGEEGIVYADLDLGIVESTRQAIPVSFQRRFDVYGNLV